MKPMPEFCTETMLSYLDSLRESGQTNMSLAGDYIYTRFPELTRRQAGFVLMYWMATFEDRHGQE
jgi:hypothetical protein